VSTLTSNLNTEIANRVSGDSALNTRVDNLTSSTNSSVSGLQAALDSVSAALSSESGTRASVDDELLLKIDMLFLYFFHRKSEGAVIDGNHKISFP
jgi:hypothetical protein